ncbi:hypothetical protein KIPB_015667, partial [Kipferlia bialata]|eukprot:g15667.t1
MGEHCDYLSQQWKQYSDNTDFEASPVSLPELPSLLLPVPGPHSYAKLRGEISVA